MAEVTSGSDLTVVVLDRDEAEALADMLEDYFDHYGEDADRSVLRALHDGLRR